MRFCSSGVAESVYDITNNVGWVSVGTDHDTASFAVNAIRRWWRAMGKKRHPKAKRLMMSADGGGSNGYRVRLWKIELQRLADVQASDYGLPPAPWDEQVEQDRASSLLIHHDELARQAVAQLSHHRPTDRRNDYRRWPQSSGGIG